MASSDEDRLRRVIAADNSDKTRLAALSSIADLLSKNGDALKTWEKVPDSVAISSLSSAVLALFPSLLREVSQIARLRAMSELVDLLIKKGEYAEAASLCFNLYEHYLKDRLCAYSAPICLIKAELARIAAKLPHDAKAFEQRVANLDLSVRQSARIELLRRLVSGEAVAGDFQRVIHVDGPLEALLKAIGS